MLARMDDPTEDPQEHGVDDLDELMQLDDLTEDDELSNLASNVRPASDFEQRRQGVRDRESSDESDSAESVTNRLDVPGCSVLARTARVGAEARLVGCNPGRVLAVNEQAVDVVSGQVAANVQAVEETPVVEKVR